MMLLICRGWVTSVLVLTAVNCSVVASLAAPSQTPEESQLPPNVELDHNWSLLDSALVRSSGDQLSQITFKPKGWYKATVPGTVLTSLVDDGVYPEPLYGENNRPDKIPDSLCRTSYWYRTTFAEPTSYGAHHTWLNFDGINYKAQVWVNGHDIGSVNGAFVCGVFDITHFLNLGKLNAIAVDILPPPDPGVPLEQTIAAGTGPNGGILAKDGPTFLCTLGWDWIPGIRDRDMGIWQGVYLSATGPVTVTDTYVTSEIPLPRLDSADLNIETTLTNVTSSPFSGQLIGSFDSSPAFHWPITLAAGESRTIDLNTSQIPQLHILNPRLWWPNGYGPQNLYKLRLRFVKSGVVVGAQDLSFGIRQMSYSVSGSDNLTISVNGVPVLCKGGDWGMDEAMKREPYKRLDAQIRMHKLANYTMIRNWVGQSTSEDFYSLCDKYGIMVWDEFFQPNPSDGPEPDDNQLYLENVREKVLRFRSHPCIALWCGRNEGFPPPIIDTGIRDIMEKYERDRLYQPSSTSGRGVQSGGPYFWRPPAAYYTVDEPFKTEIGSVSIPTLEAVQAMMPSKDWTGFDDDWSEHDLATGAQDGGIYPVELAQRYGPITSLADFVRKGQMANYEAFRAMYEGRNAKLFQPVTGVLTWMSNPAQPSFVWQIYSWDLEPNSSLFGTKEACEPVHIQMNQTDWHVMIINNTPKTMDGVTARVSVYNLDGRDVYDHIHTLSAAPSAATDDGAINFPEGLSPVHFVKLRLLDSRGKELSENFYWRETKKDDFQALNDLPLVSLDGKVTSAVEGSNVYLTVTLNNPTNAVALMAHLQLRGKRSGQRILPVFYSDNYISLLPGETRTITVEAAKADLGSDKPVVTIDGWNVAADPKSGIVTNRQAIVQSDPR